MVSVAKWKEAERFQNPQVPFLSSAAKTSDQPLLSALTGKRGSGLCASPPDARFCWSCCCQPSSVNCTRFLSSYFTAGDSCSFVNGWELEAVLSAHARGSGRGVFWSSSLSWAPSLDPSGSQGLVDYVGFADMPSDAPLCSCGSALP